MPPPSIPDYPAVLASRRAELRAQVASRMRLNDTQFITAIAEMSDGSFWSGKAEVIVTMPACVEE
jgi:predicted secreted protein